MSATATHAPATDPAGPPSRAPVATEPVQTSKPAVCPPPRRQGDSGQWTLEDVRDFVDVRASGGGIWEYSGELMALGSGRVLAKMFGVEEIVVDVPLRDVEPDAEINRAPPDLTPGSVPPKLDPFQERAKRNRVTHAARILSRKTLFYADPTTGKKMDVFRFRPTAPSRPVFPILGNATAVDIALDDHGQMLMIRPGVSSAPRVVVRDPPMRPLRDLVSAMWTHVARSHDPAHSKTPNKPGTVEKYHLVASKEGGEQSYLRYGKCPSWYSGGQCLLSLRSVRVSGGKEALSPALKKALADVKRDGELTKKNLVDPVRPAAPKQVRKRFLGIF